MKKVPNYQTLDVSCGDMPYNTKTKHPNNHPCMVELQVVPVSVKQYARKMTQILWQGQQCFKTDY